MRPRTMVRCGCWIPHEDELIDSLHGHLNAAYQASLSPRMDVGCFLLTGRQEAVKLWDVGTRQELLTLAGTDSTSRTWPDGVPMGT